MSDEKVVSEKVVRWMLSMIEKKTSVRDLRVDGNLPILASKLIDRLEEIDDLCERFYKQLDTEARVPRGASQAAHLAQHMSDARNCRRD